MAGCKHGLNRRICAVCTKLVREVVQPHIPQKRVVNIPKHNIKSEPTLFIDGSPYVSCGNCNMVIKQFDGDNHIRGMRDKVVKSDTQRKIMIGKVIRKLELVTLDDGDQAFRYTSKLILQSKPGCFDCWYRQEQAKANSNGKAIYYRK